MALTTSVGLRKLAYGTRPLTTPESSPARPFHTHRHTLCNLNENN